MSDKCEWCGLTAEHESRLCILKDDSTHRMTLDLAAAPMSVALLYWIKNEVDEAQAKHGKMVELTIKHIGHWPAANLAMNRALNDPPTNVTEIAAAKSSLIPIVHQDKPDPWDGTVFGRFNDDPSWEGFQVWLKGQGEGEGGEVDMRVSSGWVCTNHPPGSAVEVRKGEKCYCGRAE